MNTMTLTALQTVLILLLSPLTVGIILKCKARFQNRRGASVFQPYWVLLTLCRKEMTVTKHRSWVFHAAPFFVFGSSLALALLVPTLGVGGWATFGRNSIFLVAAILVIGSLFLVFGGMDVASAFGGMGASREMTLAALVEPAVILVLVTLGVAAQSWHLDGIVETLAAHPWYSSSPFILVTLVALGFIILAENARYPVDNPATHLELTMVHEAMILEYSGPYLAMMEAASAIRLTVLSVLFMDILMPFGIVGPATGVVGVIGGIVALVVKLAVSAFAVAFIESTIVKMRFYRMQEYMSTAYLLALGGFVLTLVFLR